MLELTQKTHSPYSSKPKKVNSLLFTFIVIIVFGLGLLTGYLLKEDIKQNSIQPVQTVTAPTHMPSPSLAPASVNTVVQNYYQQHITCLKNHFAHPTGSPQQACSYNQTNILTPSLNTNLQQLTGYNRVLCSKTVPQEITYDKAVINGPHATTNVYTQATASAKQTIKIGLDLANNEWKISSVTCLSH